MFLTVIINGLPGNTRWRNPTPRNGHLVHKERCVLVFLWERGIMGTYRRRVWRERMRLSKNEFGHQHVRVYFINALMFVLLLNNNSDCYISSPSGSAFRSSACLWATIFRYYVETCSRADNLQSVIGTAFAGDGKDCCAAMRGAYEEQDKEASNICFGLLMSTTGYPRQHEMKSHYRREPLVTLSIISFDQHWWLVQPPHLNDTIDVHHQKRQH